MTKKVLHCTAVQVDEWWIGECLELGLFVQGKNQNEVRRNMEEAIALYLTERARLLQAGERVVTRPSRYYRVKLLRWYLGYFFFAYLPSVLARLNHRVGASQQRRVPFCLEAEYAS